MEPKNLLDDSWQVGDRCYAIYSGDDLWYPAILKKKERNEEGVIGWIVFYEGHDDEEWRSEDQIEETELFEENKTDRQDNADLFKLPPTNKNKPKKQKKNKKEVIPIRKVTERRSNKNAPSLPPPELIPPPPPGLSEELSDLLLSWFIAGYKTGTYSVKNQ